SVDHRERDTRIDQPEATTFGVDDRATVAHGDSGEQHALVADTEDDQRTLSGERAASQCLFDNDEATDDRDDEHAEKTDQDDTGIASDEESDIGELPAATTSDDTAHPIATDGGHVEDESEDDEDVGDTHDDRDDPDDPTFDSDAETVTEAWEGAFLSASWGYDQTNVELAQIVEVSDSGKTVLARKVGAERVEHAEGSEYLRPTAEQYGDEFRLHVRNDIDDNPKFRGSYPLANDGDMKDGP